MSVNFTLRALQLAARSWRRTAVVVAAASVAMGAQAAVVFDSLTGAQLRYNQCFLCEGAPDIAEVGDIITLAGTDRKLTNIAIILEQDRTLPILPYQVQVSLGVYSVDSGLLTTLIASRTSTYDLPVEGLYEMKFNFKGVTVPDTFYYGISVASASDQVANLRLSLWDYFGPADDGDGNALPLGTDPGTEVFASNDVSSVSYARMAGDLTVLRVIGADGWGEELASGFTPAIQISAVPEPETASLFLAGGLALCSMVRRRSRQR